MWRRIQLYLEGEARRWDVIPSAARLYDVSADWDGGDTDVYVALVPTRHGAVGLEGDAHPLAAPARAERRVHQEAWVAGVHGGRVAGVAVGSEGGLGGGGHARVPGGAPVGHDRLVGERVDVETRQHAAAALPAGTAGQHVGQPALQGHGTPVYTDYWTANTTVFIQTIFSSKSNINFFF